MTRGGRRCGIPAPADAGCARSCCLRAGNCFGAAARPGGLGLQGGPAGRQDSSYVTSPLPAPGSAGCARAAAGPPFPPGLFLIRG